MQLVERPSVLDLRWSEEDRRIFVGARETWDLWHSWLQGHQPTDDQVYRKLLLDLFFDYRNAYHLGGDFDTADPAYDEFNRCTGTPIRSMEDYVGRIISLLDHRASHHQSSPSDLAAATLAFIVTGDPSVSTS